jgi:Flp pilus assembly protein TadG
MIRRKHKPRKGAYVLELAFTLPFILLFLFAILEFGRYLMTRNQLENAVREAARIASARTNDMTTAQIQTIVTDYLQRFNTQLASGYTVEVYKADPATGNPLDANDQVVTVPNAPFNNAKFGQGIAVRVNGTYLTIFGGMIVNRLTFVRVAGSFPVQVTSIMYSEGN